MSTDESDQPGLARRITNAWDRFTGAMGTLTPPGTGLAAVTDPTSKFIGPRPLLATERDLGLAPAAPTIRPGIATSVAPPSDAAPRGGVSQPALTQSVAPRTGFLKADDTGAGPSDPTSPASVAKAAAPTSPSALLQSIIPGIGGAGRAAGATRPAPVYTEEPQDRYVNPVGPGMHVRGTPYKEAGAPDIDPRQTPGTPAYYAQMAKFRPNPMDPMAVNALIGRGGGTPALDKALASYYGDKTAGGGGLGGGVPTPAGPASWAIPTLRGGLSGVAVGYNLAQQAAMAKRGIAPDVLQPGFEWNPYTTAAFGKSMTAATATQVALRKQAMEEREAEAKIGGLKEEKPARSALLKAQSMEAEEKAKEIEERRKPESKAEQQLLKQLQVKGGKDFLNTPAGVKLQEEAGWPVDPDIRIGAKIPKGQTFEDLTPQQAHAMHIPMNDILASSKRTDAQADLNNILHGVPPGTSLLMRPQRLTPLPRAQAIAQAKAGATPAQRQYIDELMEHEANLQ